MGPQCSPINIRYPLRKASFAGSVNRTSPYPLSGQFRISPEMGESFLGKADIISKMMMVVVGLCFLVYQGRDIGHILVLPTEDIRH